MPASNLGRTIDVFTPDLPGRQTVTNALVWGVVAVWPTPDGHSVGVWDDDRNAYRVVRTGSTLNEAIAEGRRHNGRNH